MMIGGSTYIVSFTPVIPPYTFHLVVPRRVMFTFSVSPVQHQRRLRPCALLCGLLVLTRCVEVVCPQHCSNLVLWHCSGLCGWSVWSVACVAGRFGPVLLVVWVATDHTDQPHVPPRKYTKLCVMVKKIVSVVHLHQFSLYSGSPWDGRLFLCDT